jgi:transposase-like protein
MKNGQSPNGTQRWFCKGCRKYFQRFFTHKGRLPEVKGKILSMTTNGSGKRDNVTCEKLLEKMKHFPIRSYSTDNWESYSSLLPAEKLYASQKTKKYMIN